MTVPQQVGTDTPPRVLIVDDDPSIQVLYAAYLTRNGCVCEKAVNGRDALQALMRQSFDVLVVDMRMEQMDGLVFVEEALRIWPWIGVVISSGFVTADIVTRAAALGVTRVLRKTAELSEFVRNVLEEAAAKRATAAREPQDNTLKLMRSYIRLLTRLTASNAEPGRLAEELCHFSGSLADMLHADASGIMLSRDDERTLTITPRRPLAPEFLAAMRTEMTQRYQRLSGQTVALDSFEQRTEGCAPAAEAPAAPGKLISVPIMIEGAVRGLLTLATVDTIPYSPSDVSLLYHAANHVSAVFLALHRMHSLAVHDSLTGLPNRMRLEQHLSEAWQLSRRYEFSMGILVADMDDFKTVNDSFGHAVGDDVLREFAAIVTRVARATDVVARYGGDEFIAILPRAEDAEIAAFARRLLSAVRKHVFCADSHRLNLSLSIGAATSANPTRPGNGPELLRQADRALYMAKRAGKDRVVVWPGVHEERRASDAGASPTREPPADANRRARILAVDDDNAVLAALRSLLQMQDCDVTAIDSGQAAIDEIAAHGANYDIVLTDLVMPGVDGRAVVTAVRDSGCLAVPIIMSAVGTKEDAIECLRIGVYDFLDKPIDIAYVPVLIRRALDYRRLRIDNQRYRDNLEQMVKDRSGKLASAVESLRASYEFTLKAFVGLLDARERQTGEHSMRVRELAVVLATQMGLQGRDIEVIASAALLHDIGKIGIADQVLLKPTALDDEQWDIMKRHPAIGYEILRTSPFLEESARIVLQHHERFDGGGYPNGLVGAAIDPRARIFAVADAYDCMRTHRVYRDGMGADEARAEIVRNRGAQFDPAVVDAFVDCQSALEAVLAAHAREAESRRSDTATA